MRGDHARTERRSGYSLPGAAPISRAASIADARTAPANRPGTGRFFLISRHRRQYRLALAAHRSRTASPTVSRRPGRTTGIRAAGTITRGNHGARHHARHDAKPAPSLCRLVACIPPVRPDREQFRHPAVYRVPDLLVAPDRSAGAGKNRGLDREHPRCDSAHTGQGFARHPPQLPRSIGLCATRTRNRCHGRRNDPF